MTKEEFFLMLDELMDEDAGTTQSGAKLSEMEAWDSLTLMEFIATVDREFGVVVEPKQLAEAETVDDLLALTGDRVTA